jgi:predicted ATP-dependent serine protease
MLPYSGVLTCAQLLLLCLLLQVITQTLPGMMAQHSIKLVVVDSISALFRTDLSSKRADLALRSRMLCEMAQVHLLFSGVIIVVLHLIDSRLQDVVMTQACCFQCGTVSAMCC